MNIPLPHTGAGPKWLFLDLNSYFASVEQQDRPELRGRPIIVVPMMNDYTCAIAASYEAKAYGIKTGTNVGEAKRMCPGLICVLARHDAYTLYHQRVLDEAIRHVPINKIWSIDELSSRLPERFQNNDAAIALAQRLKKGIRENVGDMIRCSVGLAQNSFLAKVATDMQKPDGLVLLEPDTAAARLFRLKLTDLPGINVRMEARLKAAGIRTVEQFYNIEPKHARRIWGGVGGERFWFNLHGIDVPDQVTHTSMIGHSRVLEHNLKPPPAARLVARRLTIKAASRLRRKDMYAKLFQLSVRTGDDERWSAAVKLPPVQDNFNFLQALDTLWSGMLAEMRPHRLKKISMVMSDLVKQGEITPDLFDFNAPEKQRVQAKFDALTGVMDGINKKYGAESIQLGVSPRTQAGFVGTKIAFARVPDMEEFSD